MGEGGEGQGQVSEEGGQIWTSVDKRKRILDGFGQKNGGMILLRFWAAAIQDPGANSFPPLFPCGAVPRFVGNRLCDAARKGIHIATP